MQNLWMAGVLALAGACSAQQDPNVAGQREAMKKLEFLVGRWSGDATASHGPGQPIKVRHTEEVQYKMGGLVLLVEGTGRRADTGEVAFQAVAMVSYDDARSKYFIRSHSGGRYLETELKVTDKGFQWGYTMGPATVKYTMQLNEKGEWSEIGEMTLQGNPPVKTMDMLVRKEK
jgi:hypothetical protein